MSPLLLGTEQIAVWVSALVWPFVRIAGTLAIVPTLGGSEVPVRVRVGLAALLTILVAPQLPVVPVVDPLSVGSLLVTGQQLLIGVSMGLLILLVFGAITVAGQSIAISMGLGFALMNDPRNGVQVPTISQFYLMMATLLFLALDGHHAVLVLMVDSFTLLPIGESLGQDALWQLLVWSSVIFRGALSIALPALAAMLTVNLIMGVITRSAPQLNLFSVGFPVTMLLGFCIMLVTLPGFSSTFAGLVTEARNTIVQVLGTR